jgi:hypothetical protein
LARELGPATIHLTHLVIDADPRGAWTFAFKTLPNRERKGTRVRGW